MSSQDSDGFFKKLIQLFKTSRRPPPPQLGDGKYDSKEDGPGSPTLEAGIPKKLKSRKGKIPQDFDRILEVLKVAEAGGYNLTSLDNVRPFYSMLIGFKDCYGVREGWKYAE
jgi:hypothetical protein